jgi:hypothetical protein
MKWSMLYLGLALSACKPSMSGMLWETGTTAHVPEVRARASITGGKAQLSAPGLTSIRAMTWTLENSGASDPGSEVVLARLRPATATFILNERSLCTGNFSGWEGVFACSDMLDEATPQSQTPSTVPTPEVNPEPEPRAMGPEDFASTTVFRGVVCGSWYNESPIWVLRFDMKLEARSEAAAREVASVKFDAWPDYRPPWQTVQNPVSPGVWESSRGWLTKIPSWTTTGTTVLLKSGQSILVSRATTPPDPKDAARPLGSSCAGTAP